MNARKGILFICPDFDSNLSFCLIGIGGGGDCGRGVGRHWHRLKGKGDAEGPAYGNRAPLVPDSTSDRIMGPLCQPTQHRVGGLRCMPMPAQGQPIHAGVLDQTAHEGDHKPVRVVLRLGGRAGPQNSLQRGDLHVRFAPCLASPRLAAPPPPERCPAWARNTGMKRLALQGVSVAVVTCW